jgi:hypothetical protein
MTDEKTTSLVRNRLRTQPRELALAAFYPRTHSATPLVAITPDMQSLQKRRDHLSPPENVAKPWKKPWDK